MEYKLIYVNIRGRAELVRFILAQASVPFADVRVPAEEWPSYRPSTPYGIIPVLEFGEKKLSGNGPISRYLAEENDLSGSNNEENAELFAIVDCVEDLWVRISAFFWEQDKDRKEEMKQKFVESYLPLTLMKLEAVASANNTPQGWIFGGKVTYADFAICVLLDALARESPDILLKFPALLKLKEGVESLPNIAAWIKQRPDTPF